MFLFVSKRTRHTTATGIDFFDGVGECKRLFQVAGTNQSFFMTVSMDESLRLLTLEFQFPSACLFLFYYEFFKQEGCLRHVGRIDTFDEIRVFIPKREDATWLASYNRVTLLDK